MMTILAIAIPLLLGLLVSSVTLLKNHRFGEWLLVFSLAPGIGIAIPSLLYFIYFILFRPNYPLDIYVGLEVLAVFVLLAGFILSIRNRDKINFACIRLLFGRKFWRKDAPIAYATLIVFLIFLVNFLDDWHLQTLNNPHGHWDAWAIWNLRARFIFSNEFWSNGFSPFIAWSHPDYPLLLPAFVARTWAFLGRPSAAVPAILGFVFLLSILATTISGVGIRHDLRTGVLAGLFTLGLIQYSLNFLQYADMPLAFYLLAANLALYLAGTKYDGERRILFLAGLLAGTALWTKNEGAAFVLTVGISEIILVFLRRTQSAQIKKRWLSIGLGVLPFIIAWSIFKFTLAPSTDLFAGFQIGEAIARASDPTRMMTIWRSFQDQFYASWTFRVPLIPLLIFYLLIVGVDVTRTQMWESLMLGLRVSLMILIYFGIYLFTPRPLQWHLDSSVHRVIMQILPSLVLLAFLLAKNPFTVLNGQPEESFGQDG